MVIRELDLKELIGVRLFSGWDREVHTENGCANGLRLVIDGRIIQGIEDESDGYRSILGVAQEVDGPPVANSFPPVLVTIRELPGAADGIAVVLVRSGALVVALGTDHTDDYYPSFVDFCDPRALGDL